MNLKHETKMFCLKNGFDIGSRNRAIIFGFVKWIEKKESDKK